MDVELEHQGLPTSFGTSREDSTTAQHEAANLIASASNAEASHLPSLKSPIGSVPPSVPTAPVPLSQPVHREVTNSEARAQEDITVSASTNGDHTSTIVSQSPPHQQISSSLHSLLEPQSAVPSLAVTETVTMTSSSAPQESLAVSGELPQVSTESVVKSVPELPLAEFHTEPTPLPEQPLSDLRSLPQVAVKDDVQPTIVATTIESVSTESQPDSSNAHLPASTPMESIEQISPTIVEETMKKSVELAPPTDSGSKLPSPPPPSPPASKTALPEPGEDQIMSEAPASSSQIHLPASSDPASLPVEAPIDLTPTPIVPVASHSTDDHLMADAPELAPVKVAREREDDNEESEPSAKRPKLDTEVEPASFKVPDVPAATQTPPATNGATTVDEDDTITAPRLAHMKKIISNLKKSNTSAPFRLPVDPVGLGIPTYPDVIKEPMDLGAIDTKLKNKEYTDVSQFVRDFHLIVNNSYAFNGREHFVSQQAAKMEASFTSQMQLMPAATLIEPSKEEKKAQKPKAEPVRTAPPRRQSMNASGANARSPSTSTNAQTFALGPEGVPLIRRDSNVQDGRAKRAVVPPKRHSDFAGRPKKKKYELELKFSWEVLKELQASKHWAFAQYFYSPVDPVALNIPTYFQIIKKPMDLGTIQTKLENNAYEKASEFKDDVQLIFKNCYKFNPEGEHVNDCGHKLEEVFNKKWETKDDWLASRQPDSEPHSPADDEEDDDEESDEAEDDSEDERNSKIKELQKQIEMMSKQMGELTQPKKKKKSTPPVPPKKSKKADKKEKAAAPKSRKEEAPTKKKAKKVKEEKERFVTYNEKQYISNGISQLPDRQMGEALKLIQSNVPHLKGVEETEIELDIDELPNKVLLKLLHFVEKAGGGPLPPVPASEATYTAPVAGSGKPKKNKPMGKSEQEAQIEELKSKLDKFSGSGGGLSPGAIPSIEGDMDTSGDEGSDSEESEEE